MLLNSIWFWFFILSIGLSFLQFFLSGGDTEVLKKMSNGIFNSSELSVKIAFGLVGLMALFLGLMNIAEKAGLIRILSKFIAPFFSKLFPEVPKNHPANGLMMMNFSANFLGLDNAATPFGLKAMKSLQELNTSSTRATNPQIMFMALHASGLTLIPVSVISIRVLMQSNNPTIIFIPAVMTTIVATLAVIISVSIFQKINLLQKQLLVPLLLIIIIIFGSVWCLFHFLDKSQLEAFANMMSNGTLLLIFLAILIIGKIKKVMLFDTFIDGAKEGFSIAIKLIPYLVGMLVAIGLMRDSGVFDYLTSSIMWVTSFFFDNNEFIKALPTALVSPLSGSASRAMMIESMKNYGADSFIGNLSCIFKASSDSTFYILALYFGSVGIKNSRHALVCALIGDLTGIIFAIIIASIFFTS